MHFVSQITSFLTLSSLLFLTTANPISHKPASYDTSASVYPRQVTAPKLPLSITFGPYKTQWCKMSTATGQDYQPHAYVMNNTGSGASNCITPPYKFSSYFTIVPTSVSDAYCSLLLYSTPHCGGRNGTEDTVQLAPGANCEIPGFYAASVLMDCGIGH